MSERLDEAVAGPAASGYFRKGLGRIVVVGTLLSVMLLLRTLENVNDSAATLATIGFVVLASFAAAELGQTLSLPQVTGYILAGIALGPSLSGIVTDSVVRDMRMFNTLALGLIATSAGLELDIKQIGRLKRTLSATIGIKIVLGVLLVGGALVVTQLLFHPLSLAGQPEVLSVALILGVLSIGTSPAIVLAVLNETKSKGRLSDLVLGAAIFKDLVVVVSLAVAIAVSRVLLQPGAELDASVLVHVAQELLGSLLAGGVVGVILIAYIRFIHVEMLLFVSAMVLVVAELCHAMHLELLLVFISSGFVVRNFSKYEHALLRPLELVALPVFVVFFTNAGASINLVTTLSILPLALALCAARALAYWVAGRVGGRVGQESPLVRNQAWMAYLPQAGVTLGLVGIAAQQIPQIAEPIANTGMAVVALNLLVGPIALRRSLRVAGELPKTQAPQTVSTEPSPTAPAAAPPGAIGELPNVDPTALPTRLSEAYSGLRARVAEILAHFAQEVAPSLPALPVWDASIGDGEFERMVKGHRQACRSLYASLAKELGDLEPMVLVSEAGRDRQVPLRRAARITLEPAFAKAVADRFESGLRAQVGVERSAEATVGETTALGRGLETAFGRYAALLAVIGTRGFPARRFRYSDVQGTVAEHMRSLTGTTEERLSRMTRAAWGASVVDARVALAVTETEAIYDELVRAPANDALLRVGPATERLAGLLLPTQGPDGLSWPLDGAEPSPSPRVRLKAWRHSFEKAARQELAELARQYRATTTLRQAGSRLRALVAGLEPSLERLELGDDQPLHEARIRDVPLRHLGEAYVKRLLPVLDEAVRSISNALARVPGRVGDALEPEWLALEAHADQLGGKEFEALAAEHLARAQSRVKLVFRATERTIKASFEMLAQNLEQAGAGFEGSSRSLAESPSTPTLALSGYARLAITLVGRWLERLRFGLHASVAPDDAAAIRARMRPEQAELPAALRRWFAGQPVHDERIFVGRGRELEQLLDAEASWTSGKPVSILITGVAGIGKSSLLNMVELESRNANLLRANASEYGTGFDLVTALTSLLECPSGDSALRRHLSLQRPTIFVDDLGGWLKNGGDRQMELRRLLHLIAESRADALWIVAVDAGLLRLLNELEPVEEAFSNVVRLAAFSVDDTRGLIQTRVRRAGFTMRHEVSGLTSMVDALGLRAEGERFYRGLTERAQGVPGRAVELFPHCISHENKNLRVRNEGLVPVRSDLDSLSESHLALLVTLHRYGPQSLSTLSHELYLATDRVRRHLAFLTAAGLVEADAQAGVYELAPAARWNVLQALELSRLA